MGTNGFSLAFLINFSFVLSGMGSEFQKLAKSSSSVLSAFETVFPPDAMLNFGAQGIVGSAKKLVLSPFGVVSFQDGGGLEIWRLWNCKSFTTFPVRR